MTRTPKTPWFRKKRGSRVTRQLAQAALTDAMGAVQENRSDEAVIPQPSADQCEHLRTLTGHIAHLRHPDHGMLCPFGHGAEIPAGPSLPVCRMCASELERLGAEMAS